MYFAFGMNVDLQSGMDGETDRQNDDPTKFSMTSSPQPVKRDFVDVIEDRVYVLLAFASKLSFYIISMDNICISFCTTSRIILLIN